MIAKDLYRLEKEVKAAPSEKREQLGDRLRKVKAERDRMWGILEGAKETPTYRKPR
jgi:hypothetical protein